MQSDVWVGMVIINMLMDALTIDVLKIGAFTSVLVEIGVDMLADVEIIVATLAVIGVKFALALSYVVDMMSGVVIDLLSGVITGAVTCISVDLLADKNASVLAAVVTAFDFNMPVPLEESILLCSALFG